MYKTNTEAGSSWDFPSFLLGSVSFIIWRLSPLTALSLFTSLFPSPDPCRDTDKHSGPLCCSRTQSARLPQFFRESTSWHCAAVEKSPMSRKQSTCQSMLRLLQEIHYIEYNLLHIICKRLLCIN